MVAALPFTRSLLAAGLVLATFGTGVASRLDGGQGSTSVAVAQPAAALEPPATEAGGPTRAPAAAPSHVAAAPPQVDPPPFAPGGDDLLAVSELPASWPAQAPAMTAGTQSAAGEPNRREFAGLVVSPRLAPASAERAKRPPGGDGLVTAGDFFREGRPALFVATSTGRAAPTARFLAADPTDRWIDRSAELLMSEAEATLCDRPLRALTAELNGDGQPDVLVACGATPAAAPRLVLFLSRADGRYARAETTAPAGPRWLEVLEADPAAWAARAPLSSSGSR